MLLHGRLPVALYMLTPEGQAIQGVIDSDRPDGLGELQQAGRRLRGFGLSPLLEVSARGGHLRLFHDPLDPSVTVLLLRKTLALVGAEAEVFPKGRGLSCVRAVYSPHPRTGVQYPVLDLDSLKPVGPTLVDQMEYLASFERATAKAMAEALAAAVTEAERPAPQSLPGVVRQDH